MSVSERDPDLLRDLRRIVADLGVSGAAREIPASRKTVYRLLKEEVTQPSRAIRAGIERLANSDKEGEECRP